MNTKKIAITIREGQNLWQALKEKSIVIDRPCGGRGSCGGCRVNVEGLGEVKSCEFSQPGQYLVTLIDKMAMDVVSESAPLPQSDRKAEAIAAIDLGTTTVAIKILENGGELAFGFVNPQRSYGADVMTRIERANQGDLEAMQELLWDSLEEQLDRPISLVISGNTTMQHIMRGISCEGLGQAPFIPEDISLHIEENAFNGKSITYLPGISAFVGADIVSGLYSLDILNRNKPILLIDLGTNGEMALGCKDKLIVTSAAAGPAFEGSELGMRLHASGIMKKLHGMLDNGVIDEYGTLSEQYFDTGYPIDAARGVRITQEEIRELQMAKSAIRSGIELLITRYGITCHEIEKVYLAGGMGYYIDPEDAKAIGLLPDGITSIEAVGNSSLSGACKYAIYQEPGELNRIVELAQEIILADQPEFQDLYIENMNF